MIYTELFKVIKLPVKKILAIVLFLFFIGGVFFQNHAAKYMENMEISVCQYSLRSVSESIDRIKVQLITDDNLPDNVRKSLEQIKESKEQEKELLDRKLSFLQAGERLNIFITDQDLDKLKLRNIDLFQTSYEDQREILEKKIEYRNIISEQNFQPLLSLSNTYDKRGIFYLYTFLYEILPSIMLIWCILFAGDMISSEKDNRTFALFYTQPFSKLRLYMTKYVSYSIVETVMFIGFGGLAFMLSCILNGCGNWNFPLYNNGNIQSIGVMAAGYILVYILKIWEVNLFVLLFSLCFSNSVLIFGMLSVLEILPSLADKFSLLPFRCLPVSWLQIGKTTDFQQLTFIFANILVWILLNLVFLFCINKRKSQYN